MTWTSIPLRRLLIATGGAWGSEPDEGQVTARCIRGADFDYGTLRAKVDSAPLRGFSQMEYISKRLKPGDLIIEKSGGGEQQPVGRAVLYESQEPALPTNFTARLRPVPEADSRFMSYLLASLYRHGPIPSAIKQSTGIQNLDLDAVLRNRVSVPPLAVQRVIANYLDVETARIDSLLVRKHCLVSLLEERRMAVMTDGVAGAMTSEALIESGLKWLPERGSAWREARLTLLARLGSGHTPSRNHPEWWSNPTIPWITTGEVAQMRTDRIEYISETREMVSEDGIANSAAVIHAAGTVVLCRTASAGYSAIMGTAMATSQDFATWTCGPLLDPRFLLLCLRVMRQDLLGRLAMGSTHKTIYMPDIEALRIPLPERSEQELIVDRVWNRLSAIDSATDSVRCQIGLLTDHRQALVTAAVVGDLAIPGAAA